MILSFSLLRLRGASCLHLSTTSGQVNYSKVAMTSSSMMGAKKTQQQYSTKSQLRGNSRLFIPLTNNVPARGNFSTTTTTTATTKTTIHRDNATLDTDQSNKNSNTTYDFDYLVIGAGSGGIASARRAASYGARVGVIEQAKLGGTCVNVGCVPKKIMFNAASIAEALHDMEHYGFSGYDSGIIHFDWKFLQTNRDAYIQRLNDIYGKNMQTSGVQRINGTATLTGAQQVTVTNTAQNTQNIYTAPHILIATGGYPLIPEGEGIAENVITSDGFFHLQDLPHKAVVAGAGYIAVEMAGILQALGTDTSLVLRHHRILRTFDDMIAETLEEELIRKGIHIYRNTLGIEKIVTTSSSSSQSLKSVHLQNGEIIHNVDTVIVATGRAPMVQPLNLSAMGIQQKEDGGYIVTNKYSETNVEGIYAVGDVCGKRELTPMAIAAGRRLADRLFGPPEQFRNAKVSYDLVPTVIFSHPPVGTIGLTESEAIAKYGKDSVQIYRSKFANMYYGPWNISPDDKPKTAMKLICVGPEQLVVGLHVVGIGADEMLQGFAIALKMGATKADFDATLAIHPTAAEEFVTMFPWGKSLPISGARQSPLNGADPPEPIKLTKHP